MSAPNQQNKNGTNTKSNKRVSNNNSNTIAINRTAFTRMQRQLRRLTILSKKPYEQSSWYHTRQPTLYKQVNDYHDNSLAEYVYGIFHPDAVYRENMNIKAPSVLPIPTTNFAFKETFTIKPNLNGNFVLVWSPNYLGSTDRIPEMCKHKQIDGEPALGYFSNVYIDNHDDLNGNSAATHFKAQTFKHINQHFNKYRLTSACIKVRYTGKVLNQSGMISACASFMEFPRTAICRKSSLGMAATYTIPDLYPQLQRVGDFDTIRQGQWAKTVSIVDEPSGITCVYIPTDTLSQAFVDNAHTITSKEMVDFYDAELPSSIGTQWYSSAANISFDICGYGIETDTMSSPCITVETYYNYEIIVNEDQIPYFRPTVPHIESKQAEEVQRLTQKVASSVGTITETKYHDNPSIMSKIAKAIKSGFNYIEPLIEVAKLGKQLV